MINIAVRLTDFSDGLHFHLACDNHIPSSVVAGRRRLLVLDDETRGERPARAGSAAAAAGHPPGPRAGPAAGVAVGPAVAHALDAAGAAARGAARARVPPGRRWEPVPPKGPVGHRHAGQHAQPRRRDHHRRHHPGLNLV